MPETHLPSSWEKCRLGGVVDYGVTQKAEPDEIPADAWVLELEDIEKDTSRVLQHVTFAQRWSKSTKNRFAVGDVLYGKLRPYLNKVVRAEQDGYCTTEIVPLRPPEAGERPVEDTAQAWGVRGRALVWIEEAVAARQMQAAVEEA